MSQSHSPSSARKRSQKSSYPTPESTRKFNGSLVDFAGRTLIAYRVGWDAARIRLSELNDDHKSIRDIPITINHPKCAGGQEDPRLFVYHDRLHLSFHGLSYRARSHLETSVMLAELGDDYQPRRIWEPIYKDKKRIEKNWAFFDAADDLYAVYANHPHRVLKIDVPAGIATLVNSTPSPPVLAAWGDIRGGAPPVRHGDEFYHWFHSWKRAPDREFYNYSVGVYTFEIRPPFRVLRYTPEPVWLPDSSKRHLNVTPDKDVIFPGSVIVRGDRWIVAAGHQDAEILIGEFDVADIERRLVAFNGR